MQKLNKLSEIKLLLVLLETQNNSWNVGDFLKLNEKENSFTLLITLVQMMHVINTIEVYEFDAFETPVHLN